MYHRRYQKNPTSNNEYENFVSAYLKAVAKSIPPKQRAKPRVPLEIFASRKMTANVKTTSLQSRRNPTNISSQKLKKAQNEITNIYLKEQTEYIQNKINRIRDSVENKLFKIAWQTVNEVSRRKSTARAKWNLPAKKNEYNYGNNILSIYTENLWMLRRIKLQRLLVLN